MVAREVSLSASDVLEMKSKGWVMARYGGGEKAVAGLTPHLLVCERGRMVVSYNKSKHWRTTGFGGGGS